MQTRTPGSSPGRTYPTGKQGPDHASAPITRRPPARRGSFACLTGLLIMVSSCGCTPLQEYIRNGFKVGPNYGRPPAPVAQNWIDAADQRVRKESDDLSKWWTVFNDPVLDALVCSAYQQNLTLRQAGVQVLEARAQQAIALGYLFPQTQQATGDYARHAVSTEVANRSNVSKRF